MMGMMFAEFAEGLTGRQKERRSEGGFSNFSPALIL
jgi:hypothetical protein